MSDDVYALADQQYKEGLKLRAQLTAQIKQLEADELTRVREADRIAALDQERKDIHRQLEALGVTLKKSLTTVLMDIFLEQYQTPKEQLVGLTAMPADMGEGEWEDLLFVGFETNHRELTGIFFSFAEEFTALGWEDQGTSLKTSESFKRWLRERVDALISSLPPSFAEQGVRRVSRTIDFSGAAHVDKTMFEGIYVPSTLVKPFVSWVQTHPNEWITETDYKKHHEVIWRYHDYRGTGSFTLPGSIPKTISASLKAQMEELRRIRRTYFEPYSYDTEPAENPSVLTDDNLTYTFTFRTESTQASLSTRAGAELTDEPLDHFLERLTELTLRYRDWKSEAEKEKRDAKREEEGEEIEDRLSSKGTDRR